MLEVNILASIKNTKSNKGNLGDLFGYILMEYLCNPLNIKVNRIGINDTIVNNTFSLVGSICHLCNNKAKNKKVIIIGCGIIKGDNTNWNNKYIQWEGVRGPRTLNIIHKNCPIISDPGLLISKIFPIKKKEYTKKIGYIIHSVDRESFFKLFPEKKQYLIDNYGTYEEFTNQLSEYDSVISSSLHGIIFCHSYSIPVASIKVTNKIIGDDLKYIDYYHSINYTKFKGRHLIKKDTDFLDLIKNEWQPSKEKIHFFQNLQEKIIISNIKNVIKNQ